MDKNRTRLKGLISKYINQSPERIDLVLGPHGKPQLKDPQTKLKFNLSHSGDFTYYVFATHLEVGIDIEKVRKDVRDTEIAERLFSKANRDLLDTAHDRVEFFYKLWTFHESLLKARGESIFAAPKIAELVVFKDGGDNKIASPDFIIQKLEAPNGYQAAVSALTSDVKIIFKN